MSRLFQTGFWIISHHKVFISSRQLKILNNFWLVIGTKIIRILMVLNIMGYRITNRDRKDMKNFWIIIVLLLVAGCLEQHDVNQPAAVDAVTAEQKNDANTPADNQNQKEESQTGDANSSRGDVVATRDSNNSAELLDVVEVEGPNSPAGYISGDAFNLGFAELLKKYVNPQGLVNYPKMRRFRIELNETAEKFANLRPEVYITWSKNEKIAFWINAYNICTLRGIIDNYPIVPSRFMLLFYPANSVMHIPGLRDKTYFMVMGIQYTLEEIERDVLLGRFEEPRACFAISYGTISSAALRTEPYLGKVLEKQFEEQAKSYFTRSDAFKIDEANKIVYLSPIFKMYPWYAESLLKHYGTNQLFRQHQPVDRAILNFVKDYISGANADFLKRKEYSIEYIKYNWQLNEQPTE